MIPAEQARILGWVGAVAQDLGLQGVAAQTAWQNIRCWGGDSTVITAANYAELFGPGYTLAQARAAGCGCGNSDCRAFAAQQVIALNTSMARFQAATLTSNTPVPLPVVSVTPGPVPTPQFTYSTPIPAPDLTPISPAVAPPAAAPAPVAVVAATATPGGFLGLSPTLLLLGAAGILVVLFVLKK